MCGAAVDRGRQAMGRSGRGRRAEEQRMWRARRDERAFLFDSDLERPVAEFEREEWELALSCCGGDPIRAARYCGVTDVPHGVKALWGRSAADASDTYRRWLKKRERR